MPIDVFVLPIGAKVDRPSTIICSWSEEEHDNLFTSGGIDLQHPLLATMIDPYGATNFNGKQLNGLLSELKMVLRDVAVNDESRRIVECLINASLLAIQQNGNLIVLGD